MPASYDDIRAEALTGPWEAVIADRYGFVFDAQDIQEEDELDSDDLPQVVIVRRSATPAGPDADGDRRLPGTYNAEDRAAEWDGFGNGAELLARWAQAEAMAAGLNAVRP